MGLRMCRLCLRSRHGVLELVEGGAGNTTCGPLDEALRTVTCTTGPGYRMPASTNVLTLASFTVLFPPDLNVTVFVNGTEVTANVTATVELSSLSVLDAQLQNNIASLTIPAGFASADIGLETVDGKTKSSFSLVSSEPVRTGTVLVGRLNAFNYGPFPGAGVAIEIRAPGSNIFGNTPPTVVVDSDGSSSAVAGFATCVENGFTPERTTLVCTVASFPNTAILVVNVFGTVTSVTNETVTFETEVIASALPDPRHEQQHGIIHGQDRAVGDGGRGDGIFRPAKLHVLRFGLALVAHHHSRHRPDPLLCAGRLWLFQKEEAPHRL